MDLIYINDHKLKIMLSEGDMKEYSLDTSDLNYENRETRERFWSILNTVGKSTGFDFEGGKIFIQLYPSKEGGCEMYVTKLGGSPRSSGKDETRGKISEGRRECAYSFESLENLLSVCRRLSSLGYSEKSSAFYLTNKYFLIISEPEENAYIPLSECSFIREYGKSESARNTEFLLSERGECICTDDAVDILAAF